jgi:nucleotide-binding universal stress UspA family protein
MSKPIPQGAMVVGVDGSPSSDLALDWAIGECVRRGLPLHILHAFSHPTKITGRAYAVGGLRERAESVRTGAITRARRANPGLDISWSDPAQAAAPALVAASETADTVVVGARGMSSAPGLVLGSVSVQVTAHAGCPVVVVHDAAAPIGAPVVVGVDGSALSTNAIAYAYAQASSRDVPLTVVHGWWLESADGTSTSAVGTTSWEEFAEAEQALVAQSLAGWQEKYPNVEVRRHSVCGLPIEALVRQSLNACLIVVGTHVRGGFDGPLLRSVSQGVMQRAHCPVAVVRAPRTPDHSHDAEIDETGFHDEQLASAFPST